MITSFITVIVTVKALDRSAGPCYSMWLEEIGFIACTGPDFGISAKFLVLACNAPDFGVTFASFSAGAMYAIPALIPDYVHYIQFTGDATNLRRN